MKVESNIIDLIEGELNKGKAAVIQFTGSK